MFVGVKAGKCAVWITFVPVETSQMSVPLTTLPGLPHRGRSGDPPCFQVFGDRIQRLPTHAPNQRGLPPRLGRRLGKDHTGLGELSIPSADRHDILPNVIYGPYAHYFSSYEQR